MKSWSTVARSLNCITCATSCGRRVRTKRLPAVRAAASFSSMEAEVSTIRTIEMGRFSWAKIERSCLMPSSKTAKSSRVRPVTYCPRGSVMLTLRLMTSMPTSNTGGRGVVPRRLRGGGERREGGAQAEDGGEADVQRRGTPMRTFTPGRATVTSTLASRAGAALA